MNQQTKILFLTLKSKFYDMIDAGIKTEEYRELKKFWGNRLLVRIPTPHGGASQVKNNSSNADGSIKKHLK